MAGSNFNDPRSNDLARPAGVPKAGSPGDSEAESTRMTSGVGRTPDDDQSTPEAKRAGYGFSFTGETDHPMGGHNMDERNQYTVKMKRGSSLG